MKRHYTLDIHPVPRRRDRDAARSNPCSIFHDIGTQTRSPRAQTHTGQMRPCADGHNRAAVFGCLDARAGSRSRARRCGADVRGRRCPDSLQELRPYSPSSGRLGPFSLLDFDGFAKAKVAGQMRDARSREGRFSAHRGTARGAAWLCSAADQRLSDAPTEAGDPSLDRHAWRETGVATRTDYR